MRDPGSGNTPLSPAPPSSQPVPGSARRRRELTADEYYAGVRAGDVAVLARALSRERPLETALRRYERDRQGRTARIIIASFRVGNLIHWRNPLACWLRDLVVRRTPLAVEI